MEVSVTDDANKSSTNFFSSDSGRQVEIRDVWASNLLEEMEIIMEIVEKYPYVSMVCF
jgi:hypothetical protein